MPTTDPNVVELEKELGRVEPAGQRPGEEGASRWTNRNFRLGIGGLAAVLALVAVAVLVHYHNRISSDDAQVDGHIVPIACRIYGTVADVLIHDNEMVKAG